MSNMEFSRRRLLQGMAAAGGTAAVMGGTGILAACSSTSSGSGGTGGKAAALTIQQSTFGSESFIPIIGSSQFAAETLTMMYECPLQVNNDGESVPGIVTSWTPSSDGTAWTLKMRDDVIFHDGTKATSEDLAFAYELAASSQAEDQGDFLPVLGKNPKIDIVDPTTIVVHTLGVQPELIALSNLFEAGCWILPKAYYQKHGATYFNAHPIGTGPYKFVSHAQGQDVVFEKVPYKHWRVQADFSPVTVKLIPEEATAVAALQSNSVDAISCGPQNAVLLQKQGYKTGSSVQDEVGFIIIGPWQPQMKGMPLADVRVRQALSYAVDRKQLGETVVAGKFTPSSVFRINKPMPDWTDALESKWNTWADTNLTYDPAKAKQLLSEAGYPKGFSFDLLSIQDASSAPFLPQLCQAIASYWQQIGLTVNIKPITDSVYVQLGNPSQSQAGVGKVIVVASGNAKPSALSNLISNTSPDGVFDLMYGSPDAAQYAKVAAQAAEALTPAKEQPLLDQVVTLFMNQWVGVPLFNSGSFYAVGKRVTPYVPASTVGLGNNVANWKYAG
jgi:peptide/nickel transport system substrate-binding protein